MPDMSQRSISGRRPRGRAGAPALVLLGVLGLSACGSGTTDGTGSVRTDALTFENTSVPVAYVGEDFKANMLVSGGVGPYAYRVASGSLPPGVTFSGGVLSGKPTQAGTYAFTLEASDANLSNKVARYTLNVNELPPLSLEPMLPPGEIRGETRIPVVVKAPRAVRAARFTWDLGKDVQVTRVQAADTSSPVFWRQEGSVLNVDLGFKAVPRSGTRVALVTVKPLKPGTISASNFWYESRDGAGKVLGEKKRPPAAPAALPAAAPAGTTPASGTPTTDKTTLPGTPPASGTSTDTSTGSEKTPAPVTSPTPTPPASPAPTPPQGQP